MRVLIIAATENELTGIRSKLQQLPQNLTVDFKVTGIGSLLTCFHLLHILTSTKYDFVLQSGIAGTFDRNLKIGTLCQVVKERLGDLGSEDKNGDLLDVFELGFIKNNEFPFNDGYLVNDFILDNKKVIPVEGSTINRTSGSKLSIERFISKYPGSKVESMEGAALFYVCKQHNVPFMELRAISNIVEERNRENWDIPLALQSLEENIEKIILQVFTQLQ